MKTIFYALLTAVLATLHSSAANAEQASQPMEFSEIGAKATVDYQGDAISVSATQDGAILRTGFQKLAGRVTREGLQLNSTEGDNGGLRLAAAALGRFGENALRLPAVGCVTVLEKTVTWSRPTLIEEYSVSVDGLRQDFIVTDAPAGSGVLSVQLELSGASVEAQGDGVKINLAASGRMLAYSRLLVTDSTGQELAARFEVLAHDRLAVLVNDAGAVYPLRIDPTFSDADWAIMNPEMLGVDGTVLAMAVDTSGVLYIGGTFSVAGGSSARIAKWDGSSWSALGSGMNGHVYSLAVSGSDLYAGGAFTVAGGLPANRIAKWNGSAWSALGSGMDGIVRSIVASGSELYAGGAFTTAGGVAVNRIAKWNGSSWSSLGTGMNNAVYCLVASGSDLYAGGNYTTAGGLTVNRIAKWNGSVWSALGSGMNGSVNTIALVNGELYAGGGFTSASGVTANRIAKWNGSAWSALGSGMDNPVNALAVIGSDLYAAGTFSSAGGVSSNHIAKWNGSVWTKEGYLSVNGSLSSYPSIQALAAIGGNLYAGGDFTYVNGVVANRIAMYNGTVWSALGTGLNNRVYAFAFMNGEMYVGGSFRSAGEVTANYIAKWNGSVWSGLGSGTNGSVYSLAVNGSDLYAGGAFTSAGGVTVNRIAKWNGSTWSALGSGLENALDVQITYFPVANTIALLGGDLYVGGEFARAGGLTANHIAKWNGSAWSALDSGMNDEVKTLAVLGSDVYAGGAFTTAGGVAANRIAKWDGSAWSDLGSGMNNSVNTIAQVNGELYAGGAFTTAGGATANRIAKWNGSVWSALGLGMNNQVNTLAVSGGDLYAGGMFTTAGVSAANLIAKWDGSEWMVLGSGISGSPNPGVSAAVNAIIVNGSNLYAGGVFTSAGTKISPYLAKAFVGLPPVISSPSSAAAFTGRAFSYQITAGNFPDFYDANGLPPGLTVNTETGLISGTPSLAGSFSITISATNSRGAGKGLLTLTVYASAGEVLADWRNRYFGTMENSGNAADGADPDRDGLPNLLEYVLGGDPSRLDRDISPRAALINGNLTIVFKRSDSSESSKISLSAETSTDLGTWSRNYAISPGTPAAEVNIQENGADLDTITVTIPASSDQRFVRLKATVVP